MKHTVRVAVLVPILLSALIWCISVPVNGIDGTCGDNLAYSFDKDSGTLTIFGDGQMNYGEHAPWSGLKKVTVEVIIEEGVTSIGSAAFSEFGKLTCVKLPDTMRSIGDFAFSGCINLQELPLHNGITEIGVSAFSDCKSVQRIAIPDAVTEVCRATFYGCTGAKELILHDKLISIGDSAFSRCSAITAVAIPDSVRKLGSAAFSFCTTLSEVSVGDHVRKISGNLFSDCTALTEIIVPNSVKEIGKYAFSNCDKLERIEIGSGVSAIDNTAFWGCSALRDISISDDNSSFCTDSSVVYDKDKTKVVLCPQSFSGVYSILPGTKSVSAYAFYKCEMLKEITIPEGVREIEEHAFENAGLQSVTLSNGLKTLGQKAFYRCRDLKQIIFPGSVSEIGWDAFAGCTGLHEITFNAMAPLIQGSAFYSVTATAYYPENAPGWNESKKSYGGNIKWVAFSGNRDHTVVIDPAKSATCTQTGLTEGSHCAVCGEVIIPQEEVAAKGHSFDDWVQVSAATKDAEGSAKRTCTVCAAEETKMLPMRSEQTSTESKPVQQPEQTETTVPEIQQTTEPDETVNHTVPKTSETAASQPDETFPMERKPVKTLPWNRIAIGFAIVLAVGIRCVIALSKRKY